MINSRSSSKISLHDHTEVSDKNKGKTNDIDGRSNLLERPEIQRVLDSDVAINALLTRLKQSLLTCEEFTKYTKKKYLFESENVDELSKQYKHFFAATSNTSPSLRRTMQQIVQFDGKMAQVKQSYVTALTKMYEELSALLLTMTKMRKNLKEKSRRLEKEVSDSIHVAEKAQARYNSLCQDWDKLRMTDPTKTKLTLRGSKTTKEQEEDLQRKIDSADIEYKQRVDHSTSLRHTFLNTERPKIVRELEDLILEIDTAMTIQLQKYTIWTENLALNTGITITPLNPSNSMKSLVLKIMNEKDLYNYLNKYNQNGKDSLLINRNLIPVPYKKHPSMSNSSFSSTNGPSSFTVNTANNKKPLNTFSTSGNSSYNGTNSSKPRSGTTLTVSDVASEALSTPTSSVYSSVTGNIKQSAAKMVGVAPPLGRTGFNSNHSQQSSARSEHGSDTFQQPQSNHLVGRTSQEFASMKKPERLHSLATTGTATTDDYGRPISHIQTNTDIPPGTHQNFKTFAVPLESLLEFEQDMVPAIVRQCVYVIDTYGLNLEGIYRKSANVLEVSKLKDQIDQDPSNISMVLPPKDHSESDIYVVGSLLKAFFAALPDSLVPSSVVHELKICLSIDDVETRRNYMHGLIYKFPDAQYWTLRALIFHLKRVIDREAETRMNLKGICIIWGPTIIPPNDEDVNDINYQIKVLEVIFDVADQAFEPEE